MGFFLLTLLFLLIIPKIQQEQYENALKHTEKKVLLIKQQIKLVVDYFKEYGDFKKLEAKKEIENYLEKIKLESKFNKNYDFSRLHKDLNEISKNYNCSVNLINNFTKQQTSLESFKNLQNNKWYFFQTHEDRCPHFGKLLFKTPLDNFTLNLTCSSQLKSDTKDIELRVKKIIQEGFSLTNSLHKGKVYLMWVSKNPLKKDLNLPLDKLNNENNKNYCLSKISNFRIPQSGELTLNQILKVKDTNYIYHKINAQKSITFISNIYENDYEKFVFVLSAFEKDFKNNLNSPILKILPLSILALLISIIFGIVLFKKWIQNIENLSNVALKVKNGDLNIRSKIKGSDELGILGNTFDLMLDKLQDNIKNLDEKIEERTKELTKSVKSKELLLRELNHRVKNNLYMIINFIKLQKHKTKEEKISEALNTIENRIYTISLIHTKLFELKNIDYIDSTNYMNDLIKEIAFSFNSAKKIKIVKKIEKTNLDVETAMNCGIVLNEMLTNSFKYAFETQKTPLVKIAFKKFKNKYYLIYKDNGKGLDKEFDLENSNSLGIKLIKSIITNQLNGTIKIKNKNGLKFSICFY